MPGLARIRVHHAPPGAYHWGRAATLAEVGSIEARLRAAPGVTSVSLTVPKGFLVAETRMRGWVQAELARWQAARRR